MFMADVVHGFKTIFPIPLAIGCSWDLELAEKSAEIAAKESAVSGIHVTFAPMVDLVRDPRWGKVMETTGEDPYLNGLFARAFVRGYQGSNLKGNRPTGGLRETLCGLRRAGGRTGLQYGQHVRAAAARAIFAGL
ncbi:glycoside hydrolase family 3 N-terminal domain-containing protein [Paenibacillus sp. JTLBN-2024]